MLDSNVGTPDHSGSERFPVRSVGKIPFSVTSLADASHWFLTDIVKSKKPINIRLANAYCIALADRDLEYRELLTSDYGVNLPDGTPVVWFMNLCKTDKRKAGRVRGPSFFEAVLDEGQSLGTRHFFLGSTPETLEKLHKQVSLKFPEAIIAGTFSPPFAPVSESYVEECISAVRLRNPDIVWVGLGTPKQDLVGTALTRLCGIPSANVGAAFDFTAGTVRVAPKWIQNSGFEWLYRLLSEPRRLWKRYLFGNVRFLKVALFNLKN